MNQPNITSSWLYQQLTTYKITIFIAHVLAIVATLFSVLLPLTVPVLIDELILKTSSTVTDWFNTWLPTDLQQATGYVCITLAAIVLLRVLITVLNVAQARLFTRVSKAISGVLRNHLLDKLTRISMQQFEGRGSGAISSLFITDVDTVDRFISASLSRLILSVLTLIGIASVLLWLNWKLGLMIIVLNPLIIYLSSLLGNKVKHLKQKENQAVEGFQSRLVETLEGLFQLRTANKEKQFIAQLKQDVGAIQTNADNYAWRSDAANRFSFLTFMLGFEVFRVIAVMMVLWSELTVGQVFAIFGYLWYMLSPIQELIGMQYSWYAAKGALKRINDLLHVEEEPESKGKVTLSSAQPMTITARDLCFGYDQDKQVLDGLSLTIPAGKTVALVGASGGGKSTFIQLLLGLYQPQQGELLVNGESFKDFDRESLRSNIATVIQQPTIFNQSLRENLTLGSDIAEEQIQQALKIAQLEQVVAELPQGLDSMLGKQGVRLSGGQRQRVAIARMVLANPKLVILDEATSALDTETEALVHDALAAFCVNRTTLIIAHRLSAVKQADLIYVLDGGKVVQAGGHDELIGQAGIYNTLYARSA